MTDNLFGLSVPQLRRWRALQPLDHRQLNEPVDVLNDMVRGLRGPRQIMPVNVSVGASIEVAVLTPTFAAIIRNDQRNAEGVPVFQIAYVEVEKVGRTSSVTGKYFVTTSPAGHGSLGNVLPWPGIAVTAYSRLVVPDGVRTRITSLNRIYTLQTYRTLFGSGDSGLIWSATSYLHKPTM